MHVRPADHPDDRTAIVRLIEAVTTVDGVSPLGEAAMADVAGESSPGARGLIAETDRPIAYLHVAGSGAELAVDVRHRTPEVVGALLAAATATDPGIGVWTHTDQLAGLVATTEGWHLDRALFRMECPLPPVSKPQFPAGARVEGFVVGRDESAWLALNNEAFRGHPEQGDWSVEDLARRMSWDWFDPDGLRMVWIDGELAAFNWTKLHDGGVGEIFVIAAATSHRGQGLGRAVALEGLWDLWSRQGAHRGMLYVDASNVAAVSLYEDLRFTTAETHRFYRPNDPART